MLHQAPLCLVQALCSGPHAGTQEPLTYYPKPYISLYCPQNLNPIYPYESLEPPGEYLLPGTGISSKYEEAAWSHKARCHLLRLVQHGLLNAEGLGFGGLGFWGSGLKV